MFNVSAQFAIFQDNSFAFWTKNVQWKLYLLVEKYKEASQSECQDFANLAKKFVTEVAQVTIYF